MKSFLREDYMSYEDFMNYVIRKTKDIFRGDDYEISIEKVYKNNEQVYDSMIIRKRDCNIAPNTYLNPLYSYYIQGYSMEDVMEVVKMNAINIPDDILVSGSESFLKEFYENFNMIKERVTFRIVNYEKNRLALANVPHQRFLDLALTFHYLIYNDEKGISSIRITNEHTKAWEISLSELEEIAVKNTARLFPVVLRNMKDVIYGLLQDNLEDKQEMTQELFVDEFEQEEPAYVMTNDFGINGAGTILYRGLLTEIVKQKETDFYILPSSIHEVILLPYSEDLNTDMLEAMVREINQTQVSAEEVLSDHIYFFSRETGLKLVETSQSSSQVS